MNDAVDRLIMERTALDRGFPRGVVLSAVGHLLLVGGALAGPILFPHKPRINVADGFAEPIPRGGKGSPTARDHPAPASPQKEPPSEKSKAEPPKAKKEIIKPPTEEKPKGLPMPDAKKSKATATPPKPQSGTGTGTGTSAQTPGVDFGFAGDGSPVGNADFGDWYMAGVQRKIWLIWTRQIQTGLQESITVRFTILADGSVQDVQLAQPSGVYLLNAAAQRAVVTAAPFSPLPKHYGTDRLTIQAVFKPTS
jgi:protein TonB